MQFSQIALLVLASANTMVAAHPVGDTPDVSDNVNLTVYTY